MQNEDNCPGANPGTDDTNHPAEMSISLGVLEPAWRLHGHANLVLRLAILGRLVDRCVVRQLAEHGINLVQWRTMVLLAIFGKSTFSALAQRAWLDRGDLSRALVRLEERGLVGRRAHPSDGRSRTFTLLPSGHALYDILVGHWRELERDLENGLAAPDLTVVDRSLERLARNCLDVLEEP